MQTGIWCTPQHQALLPPPFSIISTTVSEFRTITLYQPSAAVSFKGPCQLTTTGRNIPPGPLRYTMQLCFMCLRNFSVKWVLEQIPCFSTYELRSSKKLYILRPRHLIHSIIRPLILPSLRTNIQTYIYTYIHTYIHTYMYAYIHIQGVPGGMCETSGECSLC
jgi:hypothetical protein